MAVNLVVHGVDRAFTMILALFSHTYILCSYSVHTQFTLTFLPFKTFGSHQQSPTYTAHTIAGAFGYLFVISCPCDIRRLGFSDISQDVVI